MCKYCSGNDRETFGEVSLGKLGGTNIKVDLFVYPETKTLSYLLNIGEKESHTKIKYCPMCGRKL